MTKLNPHHFGLPVQIWFNWCNRNQCELKKSERKFPNENFPSWYIKKTVKWRSQTASAMIWEWFEVGRVLFCNGFQGSCIRLRGSQLHWFPSELFVKVASVCIRNHLRFKRRVHLVFVKRKASTHSTLPTEKNTRSPKPTWQNKLTIRTKWCKSEDFTLICCYTACEWSSNETQGTFVNEHTATCVRTTSNWGILMHQTILSKTKISLLMHQTILSKTKISQLSF